MAQILISNDYEVASVIEALLSSDHFYDENNIGCMIKNPWDFMIAPIKELGIEVPTDDVAIYYNAFRTLYNKPRDFQMEYYNPPSVAGWTAYYQEPSFYQLWISSVTLPMRMKYLTDLCNIGLSVAGISNPKIDFLALINNLENPFEVNALLEELTQMLFPKAISQNQKDALKEILIPGLPDFEWNVEYSEYASAPSNENLANSISTKVKNLIIAMLTMPEYQLS